MHCKRCKFINLKTLLIMLHYNITAKGLNSVNGFSLLLWCLKTYKDNPHLKVRYKTLKGYYTRICYTLIN